MLKFIEYFTALYIQTEIYDYLSDYEVFKDQAY